MKYTALPLTGTCGIYLEYYLKCQSGFLSANYNHLNGLRKADTIRSLPSFHREDVGDMHIVWTAKPADWL